ncbi:MAG TPA: acetyltransferase [Holophagaceae bacterium]|nr:acetyltransferase [Holophagaceae bacterium]
MKELWIAGGSGAALEAWAVARAMAAPPWRLRGFLVASDGIDFDPEGLEVLEESRFLDQPEHRGSLVVVALGDPRLRERVVARFAAKGLAFATLVHPSAVIGPNCTLGEGSVVMAQAVLETHVKVGSHALLNVGCSIAHNGVLGSFCSLGPGVRLAGWASLGDRCDLGVGCSLRPRVALGPDTRVGAGAAVVSDHPGGATLVGVPARPRP